MFQKKITKRTDGRFKVNYKDKQFYGKTKAEAMKKRDEFIAAEEAELHPDLAKLTFADYSTKWLSVYRCECCLSQQKQYAGMIRFVSEQFPRRPLRSITMTDLQSLCNRLCNYSPSHVSKFVSLLRAIFRTALAEGVILVNPMEMVKRPKCKKIEGHRALEEWERNLIASTYNEHEFGLCAMVMMYAGLRRGEALYIDIDRDVDFEKKTITVRGAVSFADGNQPEETDGKTQSAKRTVPLLSELAQALYGNHGLLIAKEDGGLMSKTAFRRKYDSYITFLETKLNNCHKRWYGKTKEHKALLAQGQPIPAWKPVTIRCHDFRVDFCTRCYYAGIPLKTLQKWMGHADTKMEVLLSRIFSSTPENNLTLLGRGHTLIVSQSTPDTKA